MKAKTLEKGQALILIVFGIVALIGLTGLAIDGGNAYSDRRNAQNAADTAAFAAALAKINNQTTISNAACDRAASNGYPCTGTAATVTVNNPPANGCGGASNPYAGNSQYIQVIINTNVSTYFAPVVGIRQLHNCVEAIARAQPGTQTTLYNGNAVVGLAPSGCDAVYLAGNEQLQTWGGGVFSNSSDTCGLHFQGSSNTQTHGPGGYSMVASGYQTTGNPTVDDHGNGFNYNQSQYPYPPPNLPNPSCGTTNASITGSSMSAGNYTGTFPPSGVTSLQSGVYCISGDFTMHGGQLNGGGVVIVLENGAIDWNGNAQPTLSAPTSGPFTGLLIYAPVSNTNTMKINGNSNSTLTGTILLPGAPIVINGNNSQLQKTDSQLIGYTVNLSGSSDTQIVMNTSHQFQPLSAPMIQLIK